MRRLRNPGSQQGQYRIVQRGLATGGLVFCSTALHSARNLPDHPRERVVPAIVSSVFPVAPAVFIPWKAVSGVPRSHECFERFSVFGSKIIG